MVKENLLRTAKYEYAVFFAIAFLKTDVWNLSVF